MLGHAPRDEVSPHSALPVLRSPFPVPVPRSPFTVSRFIFPPMDFRIESTRGGVVESIHRVSAAVVDAKGRLVASAGDPSLVTFWRSAAKPFQAIPLVSDGAADRWQFDERALALACASHSSEPVHRELAEGDAAGRSDSPRAPWPAVPIRLWARPSRRRWCGTGLRCRPAGATARGSMPACWPWRCTTTGPSRGTRRRAIRYRSGSSRKSPAGPASLRNNCCKRWTDVPLYASALPLEAMALAYARFASSKETAAVRLRTAMVRHPDLVAGSGRPCTDIMTAGAGRLVAKIGADGIYCAGVDPGWPGYRAQGGRRRHAVVIGGAARAC